MRGGTEDMRPGRAREAIILALACVSPWAFGSVDAWAQLVLFGGIALVTVLDALDRRAMRVRGRPDLPSLALAGLVLLALLQAAPLPGPLLGWLSPGMASLRDEVLPAEPERLLGDEGPTVPLPPPTLSQDPDATIHAAARLAAAWLLFRAVLGLGGGYAALRRFGLVIAANATALALFSLIQALTWNGRIYWVGPYSHGDAWSGGGPFVCHSHLAEYLNLGLGFALGALIVEGGPGPGRARGGRVWAAYAAGVIVVGIVTSHSRGGLLAMLGAAALTLALMRARSARVWSGLVAMLAVVGLTLSVVGDSSPYLERIATIWGSDDAYESRSTIWEGAARAWQDHPVWGTGLGTFAQAIVPYLDRDVGLFYARAENEYVDLLAEGGLIGIGLSIAAAVGIGRRAGRALRGAPTGPDRAATLGGIFGIAAIALHSLSDFGLHVPGVAVPLVILCGHLARLGSPQVVAAAPAPPDQARRRLLGGAITGAATSALAVTLVALGIRDARLEAQLAEGDVPPPGAYMPTASDLDASAAGLERMRSSLDQAIRLRPDWSEGHVRLGLVQLAFYRRSVLDLIGDAVPAPEAATASDPLHLLGIAHGGPGGPMPASSLLAHEPVRRHLAPAARSFLQARRCSPFAALPHAKLATLDYLLDGGDPASTHARHALLRAGNDGSVLAEVALAAVAIGDLNLAATAWRRLLIVRESSWQAVADAAATVLPPDRILTDVVPDGRNALRFAERLYSGPGAEPARDRFLQAAVERLPHDQGLSPSDRLHLEAVAWAALGRRDRARERMEYALALQPLRSDWRGELIGWLLRWEEVDEAHGQALVWMHLTPDDPSAREALDRAAEALARHVPGLLPDAE